MKKRYLIPNVGIGLAILDRLRNRKKLDIWGRINSNLDISMANVVTILFNVNLLLILNWG